MKIIVAADKNWGIGKDNKLLVSIPADMKMFRQETTGKVCVMGRKTLESFPGGLPLKNRTNIVLTRNENYKVKDAIIVHSIEELMEELKKYPAEDVYCIGGDTIYKQLLPYCDVAQVTKIDFALCCHMPLWIFIQIRKITVCNIGEIDLGDRSHLVHAAWEADLFAVVHDLSNRRDNSSSTAKTALCEIQMGRIQAPEGWLKVIE